MVFYPEFKGNPVAARARAVDVIINKATKELNLARDDVVVRPLTPVDIGMSSGNAGGTYVQAVVLTTYTDLVSGGVSVANNAWLSMHGMMLAVGPSLGNTAPVTLAAGSIELMTRTNTIQSRRITRKGATTRYWDTTPIPFFFNQTGFADDPFTVDQNTNITLSLLATANTTLVNTKYAFLGDVCERKGRAINPTQ